MASCGLIFCIAEGQTTSKPGLNLCSAWVPAIAHLGSLCLILVASARGGGGILIIWLLQTRVGVSVFLDLSLSPGGTSSPKASPCGLGLSRNTGLGKDALWTWWLASERRETEATRRVKGHSWKWPSIPSEQAIGQTFHAYVLLVRAAYGSTQI